jgi:hypothetical protein
MRTEQKNKTDEELRSEAITQHTTRYKNKFFIETNEDYN